MANSSPPSRAIIFAFAQDVGDARRHRLQHGIAGGVSEQVVDFLEPVEIETEHGEPFALTQGGDFLLHAGVEMAAVGKRGQRIVMRQIADVLLGVLARLQIANRDDVMRPSGKNDRPQDQFDRAGRSVGMAQTGFNRLVRTGQQFCASSAVGKTALQPRANQAGSAQSGQGGKTVLTETMVSPSQTSKPLDRCIGEIAHAVDLKFRTAPVADIEHGTRQRQSNDDEPCQRHADCEPACGQRRLRDRDSGIGDDPYRTHCREVMAADRQRQQTGPADLVFFPLAMQADGKRDRADQRSNHNRGGHQNGIPEDHPLDFKSRHTDVVHRRDATRDDGAAKPRPVTPVRNDRDREARASQQNSGDQRHSRQGDVVAARDPRRERQHGDEMRGPDTEAGGDRRHREPDAAHVAHRSARMTQQVDGRERRQRTNNGGEHHKPQVVGVGDATINF